MFSSSLALKKLLLQFDKEGGVGRLEIEMFLNELGNYPTDEELNAKIDKYDGDGKYFHFYRISQLERFFFRFWW